ncbi:MAG TPA: hypothetical protein VMW42_14135, partial [Desulfatiglandales bacterium]|nr:hypothetical protein [Desulfatiglandales bacterium]
PIILWGSAFRILYLRRLNYLFPEIATKILRRSYIHFTAENFSQLNFHTCQAYKPRYMGWVKLHEYIQIAFRVEVIPESGTEKRQFPDMVPLTEFFYSLLGDLDMYSFFNDKISIISEEQRRFYFTG